MSKFTVGTRGVTDIRANSIWRLSANTLGTWGVVSRPLGVNLRGVYLIQPANTVGTRGDFS